MPSDDTSAPRLARSIPAGRLSPARPLLGPADAADVGCACAPKAPPSDPVPGPRPGDFCPVAVAGATVGASPLGGPLGGPPGAAGTATGAAAALASWRPFGAPGPLRPPASGGDVGPLCCAAAGAPPPRGNAAGAASAAQPAGGSQSCAGRQTLVQGKG